ncbi:MAG: bifunctional riboflavin kinase/FAD synthetase [Actinobacteria bacterium]|uniref:Bifunctional riboflavin kinase/FMN adenylyltransferase n=1 Tax=freshwater metagenome TaxID=449393 RepID=A0A6J7P5K5_9ZZZZ|nr:bifunctional riboflavin kinase/FAD synthetase [Actinomycetota bacterium]MSW90214.1 bifunctional riboflavin kinase/FAD synthetase [Actinomycetota bacterium]MSX88266.1 bifunctional riboflavin kinase/FAD synthetase [Actinomycetota bacterium]MSY71339.1 bifunctional riboflavin kinase/FAD synthetase [Actinomycetota bacterium]
MQVLQDRRDRLAPGAATAISIGVFDGVHLGHQHVLRQLRADAERLGVASAVVTFDTHPALVLRPESAPRLLTTLPQKLELLAANGVDVVYVVHFDQERAGTTAEEFVREVFVDSLRARAIVVGEDFHFGKDRRGTVARLRELGADAGFVVRGLELIRHAPGALEPVTSTAVRRALAGGDVTAASAMLGRPYEVRGTVVPGAGRGAPLGFPTANIDVPAQMAWPADAVYAGWYERPDGSRWPAAINIGRRPTFVQHAATSVIEAHLIGSRVELLGEDARLSFVELLRSEQRFSDAEALVAQLQRDVDAARTVLAAHEP